jgi:hypothetical protein
VCNYSTTTTITVSREKTSFIWKLPVRSRYLADARARVYGLALELTQYRPPWIERFILVDEPLQAIPTPRVARHLVRTVAGLEEQEPSVQRMRLKGRQRGGHLLSELPSLLLGFIVRVLVLMVDRVRYTLAYARATFREEADVRAWRQSGER